MAWSRPDLDIEVLDSLAALEAAEGEWRGLWERDPAATPFQSPDWLLPWTRHLWGGGRLRALCVRRGEEAAAFAPFFLWGYGARRQCIRLSFLGAGISDHLDLTAAPECARAAAARILRHLAAGSEWDIGDLRDLPAGSALLAAEMPPELAARRARCSVCPVLEPPETFDQLLRSLDSPFRHNLRTAQNRLRRAGTVEFARGSGPEREALLRELFRLHAARWRERGETGVLAAARLERFHLEAAARLDAAGCLRLHGLRLNGETIAVQYNLRRGPRHYFYLSGFDPAHARLSPGAVLVAEAIRQAIEEGAAAIDFLRQREEFKYQWGARDVPQFRLRLLPAAGRARLAA